MNWDTLQHEWQGLGGDILDSEQARAIVLAARDRSESLHKSVRRRDRLETIVALMLAPFFAVAGFIEGQDGNWLTVAGCVVLVAACLYIPIKMRSARRLLPEAKKDKGLVNYLRDEHSALAAQIKLLRGVLSWYLGPTTVGVLMVFIGISGASTASVIYTMIVLGVNALIYVLNIRAANRQFAPRMSEIEAELESLVEV